MAKRVRRAASQVGELLDEFQKREVLAILSVGGGRSTAAKYVRCAATTIRRAAERDAEFAKKLRRAEASLEVAHLKNIETAGQKYWRASAWLLERMYPDRYGARKAATWTREQVQGLLDRFLEIVLAEAPALSRRKRMATRLEQLAGELASESEAKRGDSAERLSETDDSGLGRATDAESD